MPNTISAKKRLRQNVKRRDRNRAIKRDIKFHVKQFLEVVDKGTIEEAQAAFQLCVKRLDKAANRNLFHKNKSARKKSQLAKILNEKRFAKPPETTEDEE
ncbi:MAG: 30S ribosomal protein S20 [Gemmataceae bacterium]